MKSFLVFALVIILASLSFAQQQQQSQQQTQLRTQAAPAPPKLKVKVGDRAPDFTLNDTDGHPVKLSDFRGKKSVILAFYVLAFTGG